MDNVEGEIWGQCLTLYRTIICLHWLSCPKSRSDPAFASYFDVSLWQIALTLGTALLTQYAGTRFNNLPSFDPRSPLDLALLPSLTVLDTHPKGWACAGCQEEWLAQRVPVLARTRHS